MRIQIQNYNRDRIEHVIKDNECIDNPIQLVEDDNEVLLSVKENNILLLRSTIYYQTPFLLPTEISYSEENLLGVILFFQKKYKESSYCFSDIYLRSVANLCAFYNRKENGTPFITRNLIDYVVEDSVYYSNIAISQHYAQTDNKDFDKLKFLYEQALHYVSDYKDELHLLKYYLLFCSQYQLFEEAKSLLKQDVKENNPLFSNYSSMLNSAYAKYQQNQNTQMTFQEVANYF